MSALETPLPRSRKPVKKPTPVKLSVMPKARTIAFKAFWLMHSEAQHGSGLTPVQYANAHRLPVRRMRRESRAFSHAVPAQDWRDMLHPKGLRPRQTSSNLRQELRTGSPILTAERSSPGVSPNPPDHDVGGNIAMSKSSPSSPMPVTRRTTFSEVARWHRRDGADDFPVAKEGRIGFPAANFRGRRGS